MQIEIDGRVFEIHSEAVGAIENGARKLRLRGEPDCEARVIQGACLVWIAHREGVDFEIDSDLGAIRVAARVISALSRTELALGTGRVPLDATPEPAILTFLRALSTFCVEFPILRAILEDAESRAPVEVSRHG